MKWFNVKKKSQDGDLDNKLLAMSTTFVRVTVATAFEIRVRQWLCMINVERFGSDASNDMNNVRTCYILKEEQWNTSLATQLYEMGSLQPTYKPEVSASKSDSCMNNWSCNNIIDI